MEPKTIITYDNREARKEYIIEMSRIGIKLVDLVEKNDIYTYGFRCCFRGSRGDQSSYYGQDY